MPTPFFRLMGLFVGACLLGSTARSQTINTIAGTGIAGYSGDGGAATAAEVNEPSWVSCDASGNYYIADRTNNCIRKINASGTITTIAGTGVAGFSGDGGLATSAMLNYPSCVIADASGNIYISDYHNHRVRKINTSGIITTIAGTGTGAYLGDGGAATSACLNQPYGLLFDAAGNLIVADELNNCIRSISPSGIITTIIGTGTIGFSGDGGPAAAAQLYNPHYICKDAAGNLFIMDNSNHRVRKVNTLGNISTVTGTGVTAFSGDGGPASAASINWAGGLAVDASGNLYICDYGNNRIRMVNPAGIISTFAGTGSSAFGGDGGAADLAGMPEPSSIVVDGSGNLVFAEYGDSRIRKISMSTPVNHPPVFVLGTADSLRICPGELPNPIDALLPATDADAGQTLTWSLVSAPAHGSAAVAYTATSTGSAITPSGTTYTPLSGFTGNDTFVVQVSDGTLYDTITIYVKVVPPPVVSPITGGDTVYVGDTVMLADATGGGVWSVYNAALASVSSTGVVTGVSSGLEAVIYTVTNMCGTVSVSHNVWVKPLPPAGVAQTAENGGVAVYPNPSNGVFTVALPLGAGDAKVVVTNMLGQQVAEYAAAPGKPVVCTLNAAPGTYLVAVWTGKEKVVRKVTVN